MDHGDAPVGRILTRREVLALLGIGGAALLGGPASARAGTSEPAAAHPGRVRQGFRLPKCIVRPSQAEGPYFLDTRLDRSDIRSDPTDGSVREGAPLSLTFQVSRLDAQRCEPLAGVLVDVWQCDAAGVYSGFEDIGGNFDTRGKQFLRGHQVTDAAGTATFRTIYPGWYPGRCVHIHFKLRTHPAGESGHEFTSQLYFDDELTDHVLAGDAYTSDEGERTGNAQDGLYRNGGGQLMLEVVKAGDGYAATFDVGLQLG